MHLHIVSVRVRVLACGQSLHRFKIPYVCAAVRQQLTCRYSDAFVSLKDLMAVVRCSGVLIVCKVKSGVEMVYTRTLFTARSKFKTWNKDHVETDMKYETFNYVFAQTQNSDTDRDHLSIYSPHLPMDLCPSLGASVAKEGRRTIQSMVKTYNRPYID